MKKTVLFILTFTLVLGCSKKLLTPAEAEAERNRQLKMITRVYEGKTQKEVLMAADRIFRLADEDYVISHADTSLVAKRNWLVYIVLAAAVGTDSWTVETFNEGNATRVITRHGGQAQSITPAPAIDSSGGTGVSAMTTPAMSGTTLSEALYQTFYARMDYLLGLRADWVGCPEAKQFKGYKEPLCLVANDLLPDGTSRPSAKEADPTD